MERNGIDKLKKACIILPLVVAVIFNSSVAAIDRENNSKLSCGIDSYYVKDMIAQDDHIWLLLHDSSIGKDAVACINEKTLELQACYRSGEDLEDEMIIQNMSVQPNGSVWLDLFYPKNPKGLQYSLFILQDMLMWLRPVMLSSAKMLPYGKMEVRCVTGIAMRSSNLWTFLLAQSLMRFRH